MHRQFWCHLRIIQELSPLCAGETTTCANSKWTKMWQGACSFKPSIQFYLCRGFHGRKFKTTWCPLLRKLQTCTDYHQRCWGAVETALVWDYASSSVTLWKKVQTPSSRFICFDACYHLKSVDQHNTKRGQCIGLWNLQEWIALWTFSVVRVQFLNHINTIIVYNQDTCAHAHTGTVTVQQEK